MTGFAKNYAQQPTADRPDPGYDPQAVMHYYTEKNLPVLHSLARSFAVSDQWYASAPCQTWPNRFFTHCGTCHGVVDNSDFFAAGEEPFTGRSLFRALEDAGKPWNVYFHDVPQSLLLRDIIDVAPAHYHFFPQFLAAAAQNQLPAYSFIEPHYFGEFFSAQPPNDQHPPHDVRYAEQLIADVYNALHDSDAWPNTLLIITYDEHGGCFDHVPPPDAVSPDGMGPPGYNFNSYGVRVPAVIVSPWIPAGSILQPMTDQAQAQNGTAYPFDHTSIIKTVAGIFGLPGAPLTPRCGERPGAAAIILTLPAPTNNGPDGGIPRPAAIPSPGEIQAIGSAQPNDMHFALGKAVNRLQPGFADIPPDTNVAQIAVRAAAQLRSFLGLT